jgi:hypothetical protein
MLERRCLNFHFVAILIKILEMEGQKFHMENLFLNSGDKFQINLVCNIVL